MHQLVSQIHVTDEAGSTSPPAAWAVSPVKSPACTNLWYKLMTQAKLEADRRQLLHERPQEADWTKVSFQEPFQAPCIHSANLAVMCLMIRAGQNTSRKLHVNNA